MSELRYERFEAVEVHLMHRFCVRRFQNYRLAGDPDIIQEKTKCFLTQFALADMGVPVDSEAQSFK